MALKQELLAFIRENLFPEGTQEEIDERQPLIDQGVIDSMGLLQIMTFIEERTGVRIPDDEVTPENFQTVTAIDEMVARLRSRRT
jgi:acyl carrier protein